MSPWSLHTFIALLAYLRIPTRAPHLKCLASRQRDDFQKYATPLPTPSRIHSLAEIETGTVIMNVEGPAHEQRYLTPTNLLCNWSTRFILSLQKCTQLSQSYDHIFSTDPCTVPIQTSGQMKAGLVVAVDSQKPCISLQFLASYMHVDAQHSYVQSKY